MRRIAPLILTSSIWVFLLALSPLGVCSGQSTVEPCTHDRLLGPSAGSGDRFGASLSISGPVTVVGMPGNDAAGVDAGAAHIYRESGDSSGWTIEQSLFPAGAVAGDSFGASVSVSGGLAIVGAPGSDSAAVDGGNARTYRFLPQFGLWSATQTLTASDAELGDGFGHAVAIHGDVALVGAWEEDAAGAEAGAAYLYRLDTSTGFWFEEQKIVPSDAGVGDRFGTAVTLEDDLAVIGSIGPGFGAGALYVYRYDPTTTQWEFEQKLLPADLAALDQFASSISVSGSRIIAGAWRNDDQGPESGSAYVFLYDDVSGTWSEEAKLTAPDAVAGDRFGFSVSLSGDLALIGASGDDPEGAASGSAYLFQWDLGLGWSFREKLADEPEGESGDRFGESVSISGSRALIGAPEHDQPAVDAGAVRVYVTSGDDCNSNGVPDLCDLLSGSSFDDNGNGVPDECDFVPTVSGLTCMRVGDDIEVSWTNGAVYDNVELSIDGQAPLLLSSGSTSYFLLAPPLGFHTFDVAGVTNQIPSTPVGCVVGLAPEPVTGLNCTPTDPCLFEAALTWNPVDPDAQSIEITLDGAPLSSLVVNSPGTVIQAPGPGTYSVCVQTIVEAIDPGSGRLTAIPSDSVCCDVTIIDIPILPVADLSCSVDPATCTASFTFSNSSTYQQIEVTIDGVTAIILDGMSTSGQIPLAGPLVELCLVATTICGDPTPAVCCTISCSSPFIRGDANSDGFLDIGDPITILNYLFNSQAVSCVASNDGNGETLVDVSDVIYLLDTLFTQGPLPPPPFPLCGFVTTPLTCESFPPCP